MYTNILQLSFLGTNYHGWQVQGELPTIQRVVSAAVSRLTKTPTAVWGCSRTDAGVHALQFMAQFPSATALPATACLAGLNTLLPPDIAVVRAGAAPADAGLNVRFDALHKTYRYVWYESPVRLPWLAPLAYWRRHPLDVVAMDQAAATFVGTHDFASFRAAGDVNRTTTRTCLACHVRRIPLAEAFPLWGAMAPAGTGASCQLVTLDITADGFLKQMVRNIAGTLLEVGLGKRSAESITASLAARNRLAAGVCAPAHGLNLVSIVYPEKYSLIFQ